MSLAVAVATLALSSISGGEVWNEPRERPVHERVTSAAPRATEPDDCRASYGLALVPSLGANLVSAGIMLATLDRAGSVRLAIPVSSTVAGPLLSTMLAQANLKARCPDIEGSSVVGAFVAGAAINLFPSMIAASDAGSHAQFMVDFVGGGLLLATTFITPWVQTAILSGQPRERGTVAFNVSPMRVRTAVGAGLTMRW